jgi:lipoprotein NlpI
LDGAFTDLQQALELAQTDRVRFYGQIYLWMILAQQNRAAEANQRLTDYLESNQLRNSQLWLKTIAAFLLDKTDEASLLAAAKTGRSGVAIRGQICEGWFFAGLKRQLAGDREKAADYYARCVATNQTTYNEYLLAKAKLTERR